MLTWPLDLARDSRLHGRDTWLLDVLTWLERKHHMMAVWTGHMFTWPLDLVRESRLHDGCEGRTPAYMTCWLGRKENVTWWLYGQDSWLHDFLTWLERVTYMMAVWTGHMFTWPLDLAREGRFHDCCMNRTHVYMTFWPGQREWVTCLHDILTWPERVGYMFTWPLDLALESSIHHGCNNRTHVYMTSWPGQRE